MTTGAQIADPQFKKLMSNEDFSDRTLGYLKEYVREHMERVYALDGVFSPSSSKWAFAGFSPNTMRIDPSTAPGGGSRCVDGLGHLLQLPAAPGLGQDILALGKITDVVFENTNAQTYHFSLTYMERPTGIVVNPRNGLPQYHYKQEGIGFEADPTNVVDNGNGTITMRVDTVCDPGHSYAGRSVLVFMKVPVKGALTEFIAIEQRVIAWNGVNNTITTVGNFGQDVISTDSDDYSVILLGPRVTAFDYSGTPGFMYVGSVVGVGLGNTPGAGNITNQNVIDVSLSTLILYDGGPAWADGTTNPATTIAAQLDKIITDLTSTSGQRGAGKLTAPAFSAWADGTANPATRLDLRIGGMISDLANLGGSGGAAKIGMGARTSWGDGVLNSADTTFKAFDKLITDLTDQSTNNGAGGRIGINQMGNQSFSGLSPGPGTIFQVFDQIVDELAFGGTDHIGIGARSSWLGGRTNPGFVSLYAAIDKIITDLAATTASDDGAERIGAQAIGNLAAGSVRSQLSELDTEKGGLALSNSWSGIGSFNNFRRGIAVGDDLNSTAADRDTTRVFLDVNLSASIRTRLMDFGGLGGGTHRTILYVVAADGGITFELAQNALWSNTTSQWTKDRTGVSHLFRLRANGGFERWREQNTATGVPWSDVYGVGSGGWEFRQLDTISDVSGTTINSTRWRVHNGKIQFTDSRDASDDFATNPEAAVTVRGNTLYGKNIVKAWLKIITGASLGIDDGFNVAVAPNGNAVTVTYNLGMSSTFRQAPVGTSDGTTAGTASWLTAGNHAANSIRIRHWRISAGAPVETNQNSVGTEWGLIVCGRQTTTT
jgi:hypothetical protein